MKKHRILITSGDTDGIGLEITVKALNKIGPVRDVTFFLVRSPQSTETKNLSKRFREFDVVEIISDDSPAKWVLEAAKLCKAKLFSGMVTAPLSKTEIKRAGMKHVGHTDILKAVAKAKHTFMTFHGSKMNVVLATGHVPVQKLRLSKKLITAAAIAADGFRRSLPAKTRRLPVGIVALNPHAGEKGIIGGEEEKIFKPAIATLKKRGLRVEGPLVPDVVFAKQNWQKFSVLVAAYHDQGLIPFKLLHGFSDPGVHLTLGIPWVRTSVDHGTAKDIYGKNLADPRSMIAAIKLAIDLIR
jgi:4-hydroxythreonine-4-phosphate dehydrogenase